MHCPLINRSNQQPVHFMDAWTQHLANQLGRPLQLVVNRPYVYLTEHEQRFRPAAAPPTGKYAVINASYKSCYPLKHPGHKLYQAIVDHFRDRITFVQTGDAKEHYRELQGPNVINAIGKTSVRDYIRLCYHAEFGIGPVTSTLHIFAAFQKPYFCFNTREPNSWLFYPSVQFITSNGLLPCNRYGACWHNKADPASPDRNICERPHFIDGEWIPECAKIINPASVCERIEAMYNSGMLTYEPRAMTETPKSIIPDNPTVGIAIATHACVPYVHMQLEARKRFYPDVPALVVDDCSPDFRELANLCKQYGADFISNPQRLGHVKGDIASYRHAIQWAAAKGLDLVVKVSRRWIIMKPWVEDFKRLAILTQYPTYSNRCDHYGFGFRSECIGLHVDSWLQTVPTMLEAIQGPDPGLAEAFYDQRCSQAIPLCEMAKDYQAEHPGWATWDLLGTNRHAVPPWILWHNALTPEVYHMKAKEWGLPYSVEAFRQVP
jgi:hypothetical protein